MIEEEITNKLFLGEASDILSEFPSCIQCIVTSPEYYGNHRWKRETIENYMERHGKVYEKCFQVLKEDGIFFLNLSDHYIPSEKQYLNIPAIVDRQLRDIGFIMPQPPIIWLKDTAMSNKIRLQNIYEYLFIYSKSPKPKFDKQRLRVPSKYNKKRRFDKTGASTKAMPNVWKINKVFADGRTYSKEHSCPFPAKLVANALTLATDVGDIVLDPFMGSATTCYVAKSMNRNWVGIEIDETYYNDAVQNMMHETNINQLDVSNLLVKEQTIIPNG